MNKYYFFFYMFTIICITLYAFRQYLNFYPFNRSEGFHYQQNLHKCPKCPVCPKLQLLKTPTFMTAQ